MFFHLSLYFFIYENSRGFCADKDPAHAQALVPVAPRPPAGVPSSVDGPVHVQHVRVDAEHARYPAAVQAVVGGFPTDFQLLKIPRGIIELEMNSSASYAKSVNMAQFGNTYIQLGPEFKGRSLEFLVQSADSGNLYTVTIRL